MAKHKLPALPKRLKVGVHACKVRCISGRADWSHKDFGEFDYEKNVIYISKQLSPTNQWVTLIHEILHALNTELDHQLLEALSQQLTQVLLDNHMLK